MFWFKSKDITGQLALVTGGASGIGREIAFSLAKQNCNVVIADIDLGKAEQTAHELNKLYMKLKVRAYKVDVSKFDQIVLLKQRIEAEIGFVDIVVNNAAILFEAPIAEEQPESYERLIGVNLLSVLWTSKTFLPGMIERKRGHIVALSSAAGFYAPPQMLMYTTSKFAIRGFMEALDSDLYVQGHSKYIKITTIYPFFVDSSKKSEAFVKDSWSLPKTFLKPLKAEKVAERVCKAIQKEEKVVAIPGIHKLLGYYSNGPPRLRQIVFSKMVPK